MSNVYVKGINFEISTDEHIVRLFFSVAKELLCKDEENNSQDEPHWKGHLDVPMSVSYVSSHDQPSNHSSYHVNEGKKETKMFSNQ